MGSAMDEARDSHTLYNDIVRFCYAASKDEEKGMIEMLKNGFNINTEVPHCNPLRFDAPDLIGSNAVHYAFSKDPLSQIPFLKNDVFVSNGADFTVANDSGNTALHLSLKKTLDCFLNVMGDGREGIKLALRTHIKRSIRCNPTNKYGLSHLHIACMMSDVETVRYFLNNGCSVNEMIYENSPFLSGYSALHLAAYFGSFAVVELLLAKGADANVENAEKLTPLQLTFERLEMVHSDESSEQRSMIIMKFKDETKKIINLLMDKCFGENMTLAHELCFACVERSHSKIEELIKMKVDVNAKVTSLDLTALHFAAHTSFEVTQKLMKYGANIFAKDAKGRSPLDICIDKYGCRTFALLSSINSMKNYNLCRDHVTRLVTIFYLNQGSSRVMAAFRNLQDMNTSCISFGAPMWPGSTLLHLAVTFSEPQPCAYKFGCWYQLPSETASYRFIKCLLTCGADVTRQDARGQTALHLAFYLKKNDISSLILELYNSFESNPADANGLSHFHIACIMENIDNMKKYIAKNIDVNSVLHSDLESNHRLEKPSISLKAGTTALHIAVRMKNFDIVKLLLEHGADPRLKNADGMTPVHMISRANDFSMSDIFAMMDLLLPRIMQYDNFEDFCKSHKVLLAEIDPISINTLLKFETALGKLLWSPIIEENPQEAETDIRNYFKNLKILKLVMDINVETPHISADHLIDAFKCKDMEDNIPKRFRIETVASFMSLDWKNLNIIDAKSGMTQLHVACAIINIDGIESLLESGADINCKLNSDSPVYPGYTPLHIAVEFSRFVSAKYEDVVKLLLRNGADPCIQNSKDETPLHLAYKFDEKIIISILLQNEKIGVSNPANQLGLSHFHIACSQNLVELVRKFIMSGVDVNESNYVSHLILWRKAEGSPYAKNCGCTPLQMTTCPIVVRLLLSHGADPNIEDYRGWNALHYACKRLKYSVIKCLLKSGKVNINATTIKGATPLNFFLKKTKSGSTYRDWDLLETFLANGALINKNAFKDAIEGDSTEMYDNLVYFGADLFIIRDDEENAMHEVFKGHDLDLDDCLKYIRMLSKLGFDIDSQDSEGKTPLHVAFAHGEGWGVIALLMSGANVNILDFNGKMAYRRDIGVPVSKFYAQHVEKLQVFGQSVVLIVKVSLLVQQRDIFGDDSELSERQEAYLEHEELTKIGNTSLSENLSLYDFLFMKRSQLLQIADNENLIEIRDSDDFHEDYPEFGGILKFQMRIAERERLQHLARKSLHSFFKSKLPELCVQCITFYLKNHDLKTVISLE